MAAYEEWYFNGTNPVSWDIGGCSGETGGVTTTDLLTFSATKQITKASGGAWGTGTSYQTIDPPSSTGAVDQVSGTLPDDRGFVIERRISSSGTATLHCTISGYDGAVSSAKTSSAKSAKAKKDNALPPGSGSWTAQEGSGGSGCVVRDPVDSESRARDWNRSRGSRSRSTVLEAGRAQGV